MIKVTIGYKPNADSQWSSDISYLVRTFDHVAAVITAQHKFFQDVNYYSITSIHSATEVDVLEPLMYTVD